MNKIENGNTIVFHPGYYIKEYIDEMGFTKKDLQVC